MSIVDWVIGVPMWLAILFFLCLMVWTAVTEFIPEAYRVLRYDRVGICYKCKKPYQYKVARTADQMYGPDRIIQGVCACGNTSIPRGNRRFAEW